MKIVRTFDALVLRTQTEFPDTTSKTKLETHRWIDLFSSQVKVRELQTFKRFKGAKLQTHTLLRRLIVPKIHKVKNRDHQVSQALVSLM